MNCKQKKLSQQQPWHIVLNNCAICLQKLSRIKKRSVHTPCLNVSHDTKAFFTKLLKVYGMNALWEIRASACPFSKTTNWVVFNFRYWEYTLKIFQYRSNTKPTSLEPSCKRHKNNGSLFKPVCCERQYRCHTCNFCMKGPGEGHVRSRFASFSGQHFKILKL